MSVLRLMRRPMFWLIILYLVVGMLYAVIPPVFEKPDEATHYGYLRYLRTHRRLPPLDVKADWLFQSKQPPLYYVVAAALTSWLPDIGDPEELREQNPYVELSVPGYREDNRNFYIHPPHLPALVLGARMVSLLFGLGSIVVTYHFTQYVFTEGVVLRLAATALVGFHPKFLYIATSVSNDAAVAFFGTMVVALIVLRLKGQQPGHFPEILGAVLGLAVLTKVSALVFIPLTMMALLLIDEEVDASFIREVSIILVVAFGVGGWWYIRNAVLYHDPLTLRAHAIQSQGFRSLYPRLWRDLKSIEYTFWANQARVFLSATWIDRVAMGWGRISAVVVAISLFGQGKYRDKLTLILISWGAGFLFLLLIFWTRRADFTFGRLLFPALTPIMLLFVYSWRNLAPKGWRIWLPSLSAGIIVLTTLLLPALTLYPIYHPYRLASNPSVDYVVNATYVDDRGLSIARLLGYNLFETTVAAGDYVPVELCWKTLGRTTKPYVLFLQLLAPNVEEPDAPPVLWGARRTYPGLGNLPTDRWPLNLSYCSKVFVQVRGDCPAPLAMNLEVGLLDPDTGRRLVHDDNSGNRRDAAYYRGFSVVDRGALPSHSLSPLYTLDGAISLIDWDVFRVSTDRFEVMTAWQLRDRVAYDAVIFTTLQDPSGQIIAQHDHQPLNGQFPTSYWIPSQVVTDVVTLETSKSLGPGLSIHLGMYQLPDVERLTVVDGDGNPVSNNVIRDVVPQP